jgi:hypothetical protein
MSHGLNLPCFTVFGRTSIVTTPRDLSRSFTYFCGTAVGQTPLKKVPEVFIFNRHSIQILAISVGFCLQIVICCDSDGLSDGARFVDFLRMN